MNLNEIMQKFIVLLEHEEYYEAHEVLEDVWRQMKRDGHPCADLVRGLINAAVAFEHIKRNTNAAMTKARKTFEGYTKYRHMCDDKDCNFKLACEKADEISMMLGLMIWY